MSDYTPPTLPEALRAAYPWTGQTLEVDGGALHYLDVGPRDGHVLLCLHGNPTWSFYWRKVVARFSDRYRVIVPDHIGCGLSEKPQKWDYRLAQHVANVSRLVDHLDIKRFTLVVHDWGGAIGMGVAVDRPELVARFVVTNTAAFLSNDIPLSISSVRIPGFGALAVRGMNGFARVATFRAVERPLSDEARAGLLFPYNSWKNRIATLRFVQDIPMKPSHPSYPTLAHIDQGLTGLVDRPMLLVWGERDFCFTSAFRAEWQRRFPGARHVPLDAGHYVLEDEPDAVLSAMAGFFAETHEVEAPDAGASA